MTNFWLAVAPLVVAALCFLLYPLWKQSRQSGKWSRSGLLVVLAIVPIAVGLYYQVRTYDPAAAKQRADQMHLVDELAAKVQQQPDNVQGWQLLGRSYLTLGLYDRARDAFRQALQHAPNPDNAMKLDYAEAEVLTDHTALTGDAGKVIDDVLAAEPNNPKALWYGGQRALALGQDDVARARLTRLVQLGAPESITQIVEAQLARLPAPASKSVNAGSNAAGQSSAAGQATAATKGPSVRITVKLGDEISAKDLKPNSSLFIFAKAPNGGPPVAVMRQPATKVPGEFVLSDANAMIPGRSLGDFPELQLVARISATNQPEAHPGDLEAVLPYHPGKDQTAELVIDKVVQ
ncbi:MAG TPA: tetratricopeptide repeat protein [Gammaproteobacteria bacterium]|nr:tetratricopeptide repeat protein [Gammaproteobacteria bacterium]